MELTEYQKAYPIGEYTKPGHFDASLPAKWISQIAAAPQIFDYAIENLDEEQQNTPYRNGGWTVNQVIHHVADSHMNAYIRMKLALTEHSPRVAPYDEKKWAELYDVTAVPVNVSITLLHALHRRWVALLGHLAEADWHKTYFHPELNAEVAIWELAAQYAWHGKHHCEQILQLRNERNW